MKFNPSDLRRFEEFLDTDYLGLDKEEENEEENEEEIELVVSLSKKKKGK